MKYLKVKILFAMNMYLSRLFTNKCDLCPYYKSSFGILFGTIFLENSEAPLQIMNKILCRIIDLLHGYTKMFTCHVV